MLLNRGVQLVCKAWEASVFPNSELMLSTEMSANVLVCIYLQFVCFYKQVLVFLEFSEQSVSQTRLGDVALCPTLFHIPCCRGQRLGG